MNNSLLARSESSGFLSQQYVRQDGAFKSRISPDYANDFLLVLNTGITIWKWVEFYGDIGLFKNKNVSLQNGYDMGLRLNFIEDYLELYLPIQSSRISPQYPELFKRYQVCFNFGLSKFSKIIYSSMVLKIHYF